MNDIVEDPQAKIKKYNERINARDQAPLMNALSSIDSPLLNKLGRDYKTDTNIIDYVNSPKAVDDRPVVAKPPVVEEPKGDAGRYAEGGSGLEDMKRHIMLKETSTTGPAAYAALNMNTNNGKPGSGAWGGYQFVWHWHGDKIKEITGVKSPEEFLKSPDAQDKYFKYHYDTLLKPYTRLFKDQYPDSGLTDVQIMDGLHFRGAHGKNSLFDIYSKGLQNTKLEGNNPTLMDRLT